MDAVAHKIDEDRAKEIWRILVDTCGAYENRDRGIEEMCFIAAATTMRHRATEFRFCGKLGFGGKFWVNADKWYVSCYREDETPERLDIIAEADRQLAVLLQKHLAADPA